MAVVRAATGESPAAASAPETLSAASAALGGVMNSLQGADVAPTRIQLAAITTAQQAAARVIARWNTFKGPELAALNAKLKAAGLEAIAAK